MAAPAQGPQRLVDLQRPRRQALGEAPGDLVVAAVDVEAFVGFDPEGAKLHQHRDRREAVGVEPVLLGHQLFGGAAEQVVGALGKGLGKPLGGGRLVELTGGGGRPVPGEVADAAGVGGGSLFEQVFLAEDFGERSHLAAEDEAWRLARSASRGGGEVVEGETQLLDQSADAVLGGVDELAAVLAGLRGVEPAGGPAAAADPLGAGLLERRGDPALMKPVGAGQPREPGADDHYPWPAIPGVCLRASLPYMAGKLGSTGQAGGVEERCGPEARGAGE